MHIRGHEKSRGYEQSLCHEHSRGPRGPRGHNLKDRQRRTQGKGTTLTGYFEVCKQQSLWTNEPVTSFFECMKFTANLAKVS